MRIGILLILTTLHAMPERQITRVKERRSLALDTVRGRLANDGLADGVDCALQPEGA
jgi:hypothetical protein